MKRNKIMFFGGLLLVIGSMAGIPMLGLGASFFVGDDLDGLLRQNQDVLPIVTIVLVAATVLIPIVGVLLIVGSNLIPFLRSKSEKNRILSHGHSADAKILEIQDTGTRVNDNPLVNISLEVHSTIQPPFRANVSQIVSIIHLPSYQPGRIVSVKYVPGTLEVAIVGPKTA